MVDEEKQNNQTVTDPEDPKNAQEGGDVQEKPAQPEEKPVTPEEKPAEAGKKPTETKKPEAAKEKLSAPRKKAKDIPSELSDEEQQYSEEEYQYFVELYERTLSEISEGQIVMGRVLAVNDQEVLVDIGFKSEGAVPLEEFGESEEVKVGDEIEVFLDTIEDADGQLILSKKKANFMRLWDKVVNVYNQGGTIEGKCVRRIKGGMVVDLMGVDAFLPGSQIDVKPIRDFDALINQTFTFKVVKVNRLRKNIVVSRRALLEESMAEQREKVLDSLEKDKVYEGTVKNITDFGVFVDLGGVDGLLHINDLSWGRINHPSEVVSLDEKIQVIVLDFNDAKDRISLGLKQLQPHPWESIEEKYPEESVVQGKVVSIADYGAFVELEKGVEGLIHISEMSWTRHGVHPSKIVSVGEKLDVKVLNVDKERKRISLGLKQLTPDPWDNIEERYPVGSKLNGRVRNMTNFGAFVEIEEGIDGLIHISDLSWTKKIKHPSEILKKGQELEVAVLDVNPKERRISLGYKQLTEDPWPEFEEKYKVDTITEAELVRFVDKGLIVELPLGVEGFVPASQMGEANMSQVAQKHKVGEKLELMVIEFDRDNKRVVLSYTKAAGKVGQPKSELEKKDAEAYMEKKEATATLAEAAGKVEEDKKVKDSKKKETAKEEKAAAKEEPAEPEKAEKGKAGKTADKQADVEEPAVQPDMEEKKEKDETGKSGKKAEKVQKKEDEKEAGSAEKDKGAGESSGEEASSE
jgi:small subunit ribosomal protein S1